MPSSLRTGDATTGLCDRATSRLHLSCTRRWRCFVAGVALPFALRGAPPASRFRSLRVAPLVLCATGGRDYSRSPGDGAARRITSAITASDTGEDVLKLVASSLADFNFINVSAALSRLAKLQPVVLWKSDERTHRLVDQAGELVDLMDTQALSNSLWACEKLEITPSWLPRWLKRSSGVLGSMTPQEMSNSIYALGQLQEKPSDDACLAAFHERSLLCAATTFDISPPAWMDLFESESCGRLSAFNSMDLANTIWAFAKLCHRPSNKWLITFLDASLAQLPSLNAQDVSNTIWALAELGVKPMSEWMAALTQPLMIFLDTLSEQHSANTLWALTVLQEYRNTAFLPLWSCSQQLLTPASDVRSLRNIYCVYKASAAEMPGLLQEPNATVFDAARDAWQKGIAESAKQVASTSAAAVAACLDKMGIVHECEYLCPVSERSIDIALSDRRVAIEVDGPWHFFTNARKRNGTTQLRDRVLKRAGWTVVSVPFFDFDILRTVDAQRDYIQGKLDVCK